MKQREIKFRAWDKKTKRMIYEASDLENGYLIEIGLDGYVSATYKRICFDEDEIILMNYTGLKDKKGKEIYEGDIVKRSHYNYLIEFDEGTFGMNMKNYGWKSLDRFLDLGEIIGNIYENKGLLI